MSLELGWSFGRKLKYDTELCKKIKAPLPVQSNEEVKDQFRECKY
jgi:hypothetical protein